MKKKETNSKKGYFTDKEGNLMNIVNGCGGIETFTGKISWVASIIPCMKGIEKEAVIWKFNNSVIELIENNGYTFNEVE